MPRIVSKYAAFAAAVTLVATAAFAAEPIKETVHLVITGGSNAGTYDASSDRGGCTYGFTGKGSWGNQLSQPKEKDPKKFNSLQLIVPDTSKAASGTHDFYIAVGFGPLMKRAALYEVETRPSEAKKHGSGTITVIDKKITGQVLFDVKTADGVRLNGTIDCKTVTRAE